LGQLLTTSNGKSSGQALGQVHKAVEQEMNLADKLHAEYYINYKLRKDILIPNGYPMEKITGRFKELDELPKELRANMWVALANAGVEIAEEDFHEEFDIPMPNGRPIVAIKNQTQQTKGQDPNDLHNTNPNTNGNRKAAKNATKKNRGTPDKLSNGTWRFR
ncbi:MAG TPA: DUF935 family protein, partial [Pseudobdellovibrionaceae bacterium]|nr:DUF935 family protein [Pseudobdellovibrionaceae bacterium]